MSALGVGKEVLSYCNKCKLTLAHIILTMKDDANIGKVECKTCHGKHNYKDPSTVGAKKVKARGATKQSKSKLSVADLWLDAVGKSDAKSQPYSPKTEYVLGDIIDHPKFGPGVIDKVIDGNKIQVIFRHEIKTLMHKLG
ncbi:MAG: hypothetical protein EP326_03965 [Deltaproteobacteria bacterium]|jgi:hypothetical protein|nr:MAG: hypothetical protein EP326_03965 [Deltaproteobacteria bacterium]TNF24637.1 MAG: hypothetical protein EP319_18015 [Deltaproteobacteria bacterium]